jgi:hypothetical protein
MTNNTPSKCFTTHVVHTILEASETAQPALRKYIPYMVRLRHLGLDAFMIHFGVEGHTKSWRPIFMISN